MSDFDFEVLALGMAGAADVELAAAASRAGAVGVLDLASPSRGPASEHEHGLEATLNAVRALARRATGGRWGIKLAGHDVELTEALVGSSIPWPSLVVIGATDAGTLARQARELRRGSAEVELVVELTSPLDVGAAAEVGARAIIAKGQEAAGWVAGETTFILLQSLRGRTPLPIWAQGGIGLYSAAAACAAGASGVVLDAQLGLCRESALPERLRSVLERMDGSETACLGDGDVLPGYRVYAGAGFDGPGPHSLQQLRDMAERLRATAGDEPMNRERWRRAVEARVNGPVNDEGPQARLWPLGQDACFAAPLARSYGTVGRVAKAFRAAVADSQATARRLRPLAPGSALAQSHGTRFPIVQGPMTRVSDRAEFAERVADAGALPFVALALMRAEDVRQLLQKVEERLGGRPWGVGILGFVPPELRREQLEVVREVAPPFALIAGGRPDHAQALERDGITTYLHVPSPGLLELFLEAGARRFVFEGRECGGHVGPRSSFVLWESMLHVLATKLPASELRSCHLLFAGGIHDGTSAAAVAACAAPLVAKGAKLGVLLGTAYLFTQEAVETGAITETFQAEARQCRRTVLIESGPGHVIRCVSTPFVKTFEEERQKLILAKASADESRERLEELNLGRLRIASKGLARVSAQSPQLERVTAEQQRRDGLFMIGQLAALRDGCCTIEALHRDVCPEADAQSVERGASAPSPSPRRRARCPVAVVGMGCLLPQANGVRRYWENILGKLDAITEIPSERFDSSRYFEAAARSPDQIGSRWGGFLDPVQVEPASHGIPPAAMGAIEPAQLLALEVARQALADAGYLDTQFDRSKASVILGTGGGLGDLGQKYGARAWLPMLTDDPALAARMMQRLPEWTEDSFAGILLNVIAGRIANRFDFGGVNYTVDAACASSLAAVHAAVAELDAGNSDLVLAGGVDTVQNPFAYLCFANTQALSPRGRSRAFDAGADGIVISEGVAMVVLKRLADARADGDRIYAVLRGIAGSSDGRAKGMTAPRVEGQVAAMQRAYESADVPPATIGLVEAHGTGTVLGDRTEVESLERLLAGAAKESCALGSVKSMIGHTKCAAGVAGMIKAALALYHRTLPPTLHVATPIVNGESPLFVNTEARPWLAPAACPRRAAVSAFGFGGTNFHAVLEEAPEAPEERAGALGVAGVNGGAGVHGGAGELCVWSGASPREVAAELQQLSALLARKPCVEAVDLAAAAYRQARANEARGATATRVAIATVNGGGVAAASLRRQLEIAERALLAGEEPDATSGVFVAGQAQPAGKVAFLFPGQGSQYPDMLAELAIRFPEVRSAFERAQSMPDLTLEQPLGRFIFPATAFTSEQRRARVAALARTEVAQPALGAACVGLLRLLANFGVHADMAAGHSYGEYVALHAAGVFDERQLFTLSAARGRALLEASRSAPGEMLVAVAPAEPVRRLLEDEPEVWIANLNGPAQTVLAGTPSGIAAARRRLEAGGVAVKAIAVSCAFHCPLMDAARQPFERVLNEGRFEAPRFPVFSNVTGQPHASDGASIVARLAEQIVGAVHFEQEVRAMYAAGARVFVEVGPRSVLTHLVRQILGPLPHVASSTDAPGTSAVEWLHRTLARLWIGRVPLQLERSYIGRSNPHASVEALFAPGAPSSPRAGAWLVTGGRAVPERAAVVPAAASAVVPAAASAAVPVAASAAVPANPIVRVAPTPDPSVEMAPPFTASSAAAGGGARVVEQFQRLMGTFLSLQRDVMSSYLSDRAPMPQPTARAIAAPPLAAASAPRFTLALAPARALAALASVPELGKRTLLVTDDESGAALAVQAQWRALGGDAVLLQMASSAGKPGDVANGATNGAASADTYRANLADEDDVARVLAQIRRAHGRIGALVHLLPRRPLPAAEQGDPGTWRARLLTETKSLLWLSRQLGAELAAQPAQPGIVLAVTAMGGTFGMAEASADSLPWHGALAGLTKTLAAEQPALRCRVLDAERNLSKQRLAEVIVAELADLDHAPASEDGPAPLEIGYRGDQRLRIVLQRSPLEPGGAPERALGAPSVVVMIGGARGIGAAVATALARSGCTLLLVGRSPLPDREDPELTALAEPQALRRALCAKMAAGNAAVSAGEVERSYRNLIRDREIRVNLASFAEAGARVEYHALDARDAALLERFIDAVYARFGRIDGVIHAAGILEDKLIADKSWASFERVLDTKLVPALVLARKLRPESLSFLVLFSSVAARFGNRGQADYAAVNEVLGKLAWYLNAHWPARVVAVDWGPWSGSGMVSPEVARQFAERGVALITPPAGTQALVRELTHGSKHDAEVLIGGGPWEQTAASAPPTRAWPLLGFAGGGGRLEVELDPKRHRYLDDHRLDDKPVLPAMVALEMMAEAAHCSWPDLHVIEVSSLRVLRGIVLDSGPRRVRVLARPEASPSPDGSRSVAVEIHESSGSGPPLYRATVQLAARMPAARPGRLPPLPLDPFPLSAAEAYARWLFHGPRFECIRHIHGASRAGIQALLEPLEPARFVHADATGEWALEPRLLDGASQLVLLWARAFHGVTPLPSALGSVRRFEPEGRARSVVCRVAIVDVDPHRICANVEYANERGQVLLEMERLECTSSRALNRLAENHRRSDVRNASSATAIRLEMQNGSGNERMT